MVREKFSGMQKCPKLAPSVHPFYRILITIVTIKYRNPLKEPNPH
jgi:hypothetical protein